MAGDGPLPLARRRLDDAVRALADPIPVWDDGVCRWVDPLYTRLRVALHGGRAARFERVHASRLPCRIDVLNLLVELDTTVAAWEPDWRPQDCALIDCYCDQMHRWTIAATELLAPKPRVFLPMPCPPCGQRFAYRSNSSGEHLRTPGALKVSETGCKCLACESFWPPEQFAWLAQLLG